MRYFFLLLLITIRNSIFAEADTSFLKSLYDRCLEFNESKTDSLCYYATFIESESSKLSFDKGPVLSLRLKGLCQEFQSDYEKAIDYYLQSLEEARKIKIIAYEISALSDLGIAYSAIQRPLESKKVYLQCAALALQTREINSVVNCFNNLGVIYSQMNQYDSALFYLQSALRIGMEAGDQIDPSGTYNNIGSVYFKKKQFATALNYFRKNYQQHLRTPDQLASLWTDHINLADTYSELHFFDSSDYHANRAMELVSMLKNKSKEADTYSLFARLNEKKGNFPLAYKYLTQWYALDTAIVSGNTQNTIATLQERFNARERNDQNKLLMERVEKERYRSRSIIYLAIAFATIGILIAIAFIIKRNANRRLLQNNELILKQNERLEELNHEKNSLIGMVSHDLSTPFATIQMWGKLLESDTNRLSAEQLKALQRIIQAGNHGQHLIQRILDIEKSNIGNHKLHLEEFDLTIFIESVIENFRPAAAEKQIALQYITPQKSTLILSDKQLVHRMVENLLSNALKYSPRQRSVWVSLSEEGDSVHIKVKDEGVGIANEELSLLFSKYSKLSSTPTGGESSSGLGLSIVKRIADELNGRVFCESEPGKGSLFTIVLKK